MVDVILCKSDGGAADYHCDTWLDGLTKPRAEALLQAHGDCLPNTCAVRHAAVTTLMDVRPDAALLAWLCRPRK